MGRTIVDGDYEWDEDKAAENIIKHGVSFPEAIVALADPHHLARRDDKHDSEEERLLTVCFSLPKGVLLVVTTDRGERERIISARPAERKEKEDYEQHRYRHEPHD